MKANVAFDIKSKLGEGAIWNYKEQNLWWVDIESKKLHRYDPQSNSLSTIDVPHRIGTVVPVEGGGALVALQNGIHFLDKDNKAQLVVNPLNGDLRFNDGKCDPAGRFWVGTIDTNHKENISCLYRLDHDGTLKKMIDGVTNSNGIVWSPDATKMYYIDSPTKKVTSWQYNNETGEIYNPQTIINIEFGIPDGMTIDKNGMLWIAHYGGFSVGCYNPETGTLLNKIEVPAPKVTSCAFGGSELDTLYITTATDGMNPEDLKEFPLSGALFSVKPGCKGVKSSFFKKEF